MRPHTIYLASGNAHKLEEIAKMLSGFDDLRLQSAHALGGMPVVDENANDFQGNALLKASALKAIAPEGAWVLSDDSGLEVDALDGAPGVYSARYAGPGATDAANNSKLLSALEGVQDRKARFVCVFCLMTAHGHQFFEGHCEGTIASEPDGAAGFGYDPLFIPEGYDASFATLGPDVKNRISHRARTLKAFMAYMGGSEKERNSH